MKTKKMTRIESRLWIGLLLLLILGCNGKKVHVKEILQGITAQQIQSFQTGSYSLRTTQKHSEQSKLLTATQIEHLKKLMLNPINHQPTEATKTCRFNPDLEIWLLNKKEKLNIQICSSCLTWKFKLGVLEYYGNYDGGKLEIDAFLKELLEIPDDKKPPNENNEAAASRLKNYVGTYLFEMLSNVPFKESYFFNSEHQESIIAKSQEEIASEKGHKLTMLQTQKLEELLLDKNNYELTRYVRMCDLPVTKLISIKNKSNNNILLYISSECNQIILQAYKESITLGCPILIEQIHKLLNNTPNEK